ncbi:MAG: hypothetical protein ACI36X_08280 [Bacteroidaceae bacterium]
MKRQLLTLACAAVMAVAGMAQNMEMYKGIAFEKVSPDGLWLATYTDGLVTIFNKMDSTLYEYESDYMEGTEYSLGNGNCMAADGIVVGAISDIQPAYWQNGEWTPLPVREEDTKPYNNANGVSADGSRICGYVAVGSWGSDGLMIKPVLWEKGVDGNYKEYIDLPYPTTDFTGRTPQYVTTLNISDDGKKVFGQVQSYDGFSTSMIVFTEDEKGEWSYEEFGSSLFYEFTDEYTAFPQWPSYEPKSPKAEDYITAEEAAAYNEAAQAYADSVALYWDGTLSSYPNYYPYPRDFIVKNKEAYDAALTKYNEESTAYTDSMWAFYDVYDAVTTNVSFMFNNVLSTPDGRYVTTTMSYPDPDAEDTGGVMPLGGGGMYGMALSYVPVVFDTQADDILGSMVQKDAAKGKLVTSMMADGGLVACSPISDPYARAAYIVPADKDEAIEFAEWIKAKSQKAYEWMLDTLVVDFVTYDYDDEWNLVETVIPDSLVTGTVYCTPDASVFIGAMYEIWSETGTYVSYSIDLVDHEAVGIAARPTEAQLNAFVAPKSNLLTIEGEAARVCVLDFSGRIVYDAAPQGNSVPMGGKGIYLVRLTDAEGNVTVKKVINQ